ncbi:helix-turn-helix domain-containing protein [Mucilaginibacter pedocola]|uniref:XRE family transcriptional regulator n=1 Tax=Mucilaginibacter pedocola TaxID=1792845 RepID=A0A1S9P8A0_9SPHI|nr:helix-turn-helix transcriptional regulator [Mucilaginibacter pedocola]OOQ57186.1 XRE family transcriptional regulator [Mucilaginibacter pedocola]
MNENSYINWFATSDQFILDTIGDFLKNARLQQNKTQLQVAEAAGVSRSTVSLLEKGRGGTLLSLLQVLRVLEQLPVLDSFMVEQKVSPLLLAKQELQKRRRARNKNGNEDAPISW